MPVYVRHDFAITLRVRTANFQERIGRDHAMRAISQYLFRTIIKNNPDTVYGVVPRFDVVDVAVPHMINGHMRIRNTIKATVPGYLNVPLAHVAFLAERLYAKGGERVFVVGRENGTTHGAIEDVLSREHGGS